MAAIGVRYLCKTEYSREFPFARLPWRYVLLEVTYLMWLIAAVYSTYLHVAANTLPPPKNRFPHLLFKVSLILPSFTVILSSLAHIPTPLAFKSVLFLFVVLVSLCFR